MPEISVIVPVYKAELTIRRCIESIVAQTFSDIELILVDDGSPDNSGAICDEFAQKDHRIVVIHKNNGGVSSARNAALDVAQGKYLMFCDSDDYVSPGWCQWAHEAMQKERVYLAVCGFESVFEDGRKEYQGVGPERFAEKEHFLEMANNCNLYISWNKVFKAEIIKKYNLRQEEKLARCEDALFVLNYLRLIEDNGRFCYGSPALYHYLRYSNESLSRRYLRDCWKIERERLSQTRMLLELYRVPPKASENYYSQRAALSISDAMSNVFHSPDATLAGKYRELREIVCSEEYAAAIDHDGMSAAAGGVFLCLLKKRWTPMIFTYCMLSQIKNLARK